MTILFGFQVLRKLQQDVVEIDGFTIGLIVKILIINILLQPLLLKVKLYQWIMIHAFLYILKLHNLNRNGP